MANDQDKNARIESAERFKQILDLYKSENNAGIRSALLTNPPDQLVTTLEKLGYSDSAGLVKARDDYLGLGDVPLDTLIPEANPPAPQPTTNPTSSANIGATGGLAAAPIILLSMFSKKPDDYTEKDLEKAADKSAKKQARKFRKDEVKYAAAYDEAHQQFYNNYASGHRVNAHKIADGSPQNSFLAKAIERDNAILRQNLDQQAKVYARRKVLISNRILGGKSSDLAVSRNAIQDYYNYYVQKNRQVAEWISKNTTNGPLLRAMAFDNERRKNSLRFRVNQSVNQRLRGGKVSSPAAAVPNPPNIRSIFHISRPIRRPKLPLPLGNLFSPGLMSFLPVIIIIILLLLTIVLMGAGAPVADLGGGGSGGATPTPTPASGGNNVIDWAKLINSALTTRGHCCDYNCRVYDSNGNPVLGCDDMYNKLSTTFSNNGYATKTAVGTCSGCGGGTYFCTYLVRDAYKLAGVPGPTSSRVCHQIEQWAAIAGYHVQESADVTNVRPGDVVFWLTEQAPAGTSFATICRDVIDVHVDIVYTINVTNGVGSMTTIDANTPLGPGDYPKYSIQGNQVVSWPWKGDVNGLWFGLAH